MMSGAGKLVRMLSCWIWNCIISLCHGNEKYGKKGGMGFRTVQVMVAMKLRGTPLGLLSADDC